MRAWSDADRAWMQRVLALAAEAYGETSPNPLVGAVVVGSRGELGSGVHRRAGGPHAEPQALDRALVASMNPNGSENDLTLYVNLEPCSHQGQTPPCVDAILRSPVRRVVAAIVDPNPQVAGRGIGCLRGAGLRVDVGCLAAAAAELNHVFLARQLRRRPFVALKVALSADACIAGPGGTPIRITGDAAQTHAHRLRAGLDAILVGIETLGRDRPRLDRRMYHGPGKSPRRLVFDPDLRCRLEWLWECRTPQQSGGARPALVFCADDTLLRAPEAAGALAPRAEVVPLPRTAAGLDLDAFVAALGQRGLWSVLVEGGGRTHRTFLEADLWDRLYLYENPEMRLQGLAWAAAAVWETRRGAAQRHGVATIGSDTLTIFDHPQSVVATDD